MSLSSGSGHICQCLRWISICRRDSTVIIFGERRKTGQEFVDGVLRLAHGLTELGMRTGDIVAIVALNSDVYLEWFLAVTFIGGIVAPLNYRWSFNEAKAAVELVNPVMLVVDDGCYSWSLKLKNCGISNLKSHVLLGMEASESNELNYEDLKRHPPSQEFLEFNYNWAANDVALICFTSGTTGRSKGVAISHTSLIVQSLAKVAAVGYNEDDVYLHTAPLCHIGGISSCISMLMVGGCHILTPKFEPRKAIQAIEQHSVTTFITVPTIMADLISSLRMNKTSWTGGHCVKKILNGGGGLSTQLIKDILYRFPNAKILSAYGMTEACSSLTFMTVHDPKHSMSTIFSSSKCEESRSMHHTGGICVGKPAPHVEMQTVGTDSTGKILTRGPHVMVGYWGEISQSKTEWIDTGDIGHIDQYGNLWLIGREKDRIKSGGENIYPAEVEIILSNHPGVEAAIIIGIPDHRLTEKVSACIRIKQNWKWVNESSHKSHEGQKLLSADILRDHCRRRNLTGFKIPKVFILWRRPFPVTSTGKLRRDEVRREICSNIEFLQSNL